MSLIDYSNRRLLNQSTHSRVAYSTASIFRHGPRGHMTSVLNRPLIVSASTLSYESPTLPTEDSIPASASRYVYRIDRYRLPRSLWCTSPSVPVREYSACSRASSTRSVLSKFHTRQPRYGGRTHQTQRQRRLRPARLSKG